jgi:hypothetical protein
MTDEAVTTIAVGIPWDMSEREFVGMFTGLGRGFMFARLSSEYSDNPFNGHIGLARFSNVNIASHAMNLLQNNVRFGIRFTVAWANTNISQPTNVYYRNARTLEEAERTSLRDVRAASLLSGDVSSLSDSESSHWPGEPQDTSSTRLGGPEPEEFDTSESDEDIAAPGAGHGAGCRPTDIADGIGDRDIVDEADIQTTGAIAIPL